MRRSIDGGFAMTVLGAVEAGEPRRHAAVDRFLFVGWWFVMTVLPIGHLTGLRNTVTTVVVICTFWWAGRRCWSGLAGRWPALLLLAWCGASIAWSSVPQVSFAKWRVDLLLPLLAYAAAFGYVKRSGRPDAIVGGTVTGIVFLAVLSIPALLPAAAAARLATLVPTESFATVTNRMPVWFPGVGDASMASAFAAVGLALAGRSASFVRRRRRLAVAALFVVAVVLILLAINNRNATLTIPIAVAFVVWLDRRPGSSARRADDARRGVGRFVVAGSAIAVLACSVSLLEWGARQRLQQMRVPVAATESGLLRLTERDTRPTIWRYYTRLALQHPWVGVGFGRTVPGIAYRTVDDVDLARVEANAYSHAHNLLLNWWLEVGLVGVSILLVLLGTIVVGVSRNRAAHGTAARTGAATVVALVATMLLRNTTDDFLVFGMASMFWILVGSFAAEATGSDASGPVNASRSP